jgi:hypothetical protein
VVRNEIEHVVDDAPVAFAWGWGVILPERRRRLHRQVNLVHGHPTVTGGDGHVTVDFSDYQTGILNKVLRQAHRDTEADGLVLVRR